MCKTIMSQYKYAINSYHVYNFITDNRTVLNIMNNNIKIY